MIRQKAILDLLVEAGRPLSSTVFVKLIFLLRHETELEKDRTFYDFVPYKFGPFSFALYWDLRGLKQNGYVTPGEERVEICRQMLDKVEQKTEELPESIRQAVTTVISRYGRLSQKALVESVYANYPWYTVNSKLAASVLSASYRPPRAQPAIFTAGYEGKSVDLFFNDLLRRGITAVIDVRANPISRKYGFTRHQISEIAEKLGIDYWHVPNLGIPSRFRADLNSYESYQRLLNQYEQKMLPMQEASLREVARFMRQRPSVLVCVERDVRYCHRSRLAEAVSRLNGLEVVHL